MSRVIWKGAIAFGLVHIPVGLYPASRDVGIDFDWLDRRSMDPVGYKRINKRTGKEIENTDIVKGVKQDDGDYVVISDDQIEAAYPRTTQTIGIEAFVQASEIPFVLLERPYYLEPAGKGDKVYALLREAMHEAGVIGIARVILHTREHLAALIPSGPLLVLNTIRWAAEIRPSDDLNVPAQGKDGPKLTDGERKMARQLIADMTQPWRADNFADTFTTAIHGLIDAKRAAGDTAHVTPLEEPGEPAGGSNVVDLTELLARSLASRKAVHRPAAKPAAKRLSRKRA